MGRRYQCLFILSLLLTILAEPAGFSEEPAIADGVLSISGHVFDDRNSDGVQDSDEQGLMDRRVTIEWQSGNASTTTDRNGFYIFTGLVPGRYNLSIESQGNWTATIPANGVLEVEMVDIHESKNFGFKSSKVGRTFGGASGDLAYSVQQTSDGGYILAGVTSSSGAGHNDAWLFKTDSEGNEVWQRTFGGPYRDEAYSVQATNDGGFVLAGTTKPVGAGSMEAWLIRTDGEGRILWQKTFGGNEDDEADVVKITNDGGFILAGKTAISPWLIRTDSEGNKIWQKGFGSLEWGEIASVQPISDSGFLLDDGGYILAGNTWHRADAWLVKTDAQGNMTWQKTFGGSSSDGFNSVQLTSDGGYILAGSTASYGAGDSDAWLMKTDSEGGMVWQKMFGETNDDSAIAVYQTSDGGFVLIGGTGRSIWLRKVDSIGNELWNRTLGEGDKISSVQPTNDGGYILAGSTSSSGSGSQDAWLIKTDAGGNIVW